ncbi:Hypothetical Protein RradSPS_1225 [Rubrobacter radiotolerans]|uniref:Uncharacterized protein n=1 Tax=Rubrobacter radiotolerans TaxID=42256 RepID=A0A023X2D6_RUBRA|nr:hypothetical protein [Rubrobacter radiotolerans]AHY46508.1 Hypothetical Protein RradSPS_1225 [Rubrobacter radiotolerans]MDX5893915.1 hypothetical protein [Rubrobacter radiotolerans]SMC04759.1 conserved hypothetical protein [Rubrobacter radiotolerans DSM 5868]
MVEVRELAVEAAWKVRNLGDFESRLERAALALEQRLEGREAAILIYEAALAKSGRSREEIRALTDRFRETFHDPEESYSIPRVSGLMGVQSDEWFFGDPELRSLTGLLLGQFQHRVAQYNYLKENEVLRRWADSYDTRLFIRRRIYDTEPVVGVVAGFDLALLQNLRVLAGGNTLVPSADVARALTNLGFSGEDDPYETLARAEALALQLELPAPLVGELLEGLARDGVTNFPEPPAPPREEESEAEEGTGETAEEA